MVPLRTGQGRPGCDNCLGGMAGDRAGRARPRSEQPIEIPVRRALVFGDAVVETGSGEKWQGFFGVVFHAGKPRDKISPCDFTVRLTLVACTVAA
jgi:hypothetical protein